MRNLARLTLYFSASFALIFLCGAVLRFLSLYYTWARVLNVHPRDWLEILIESVRWAFVLGIYGSLVFALGFSVKEKIFAPVSILCLVILSFAITFGVSTFLHNNGDRLENISFNIMSSHDNNDNDNIEESGNSAMGGPGLILSNPLQSDGTFVVLLEGPSYPTGARVVAESNGSLVYYSEMTVPDSRDPYMGFTSFSAAPFLNGTPAFLRSIAVDLQRSAEIWQERQNSGGFDFMIYSFTLFCFLTSLLALANLSSWPLINLFLCALAFRAILLLEVFFGSDEVNIVFTNFLQDRAPVHLALPAIFLILSILIYLYSFLAYIAKRKKYES